MKLPAPLAPLVALPHWVIWRREVKNGRPTKVPYQARDPWSKAETDNPATWATYEEAVDAAAKTRANGVGFVLTNTDIEAFDIDKCRNAQTGVIHPWARDLIARAGSYTEITPSNTGVRIIGRGNGSKLHRKLPVVDGVSCELYRGAERYITMTGNQIGDNSLVNIDAVMDATLAELDGERPGTPKDGGQHARHIELDDVIQNGRYELFHNDQSRAVYYVINESLRQGWPEDKIEATLLNRENEISRHNYEAHPENPKKYVRDQIEKARKQLEARIVSAIDHMKRARQFRAQRRPNLRYWRGEFYDWVATSYYASLGKDTITSEIWIYLEQALVRDDKGVIKPFYPKRNSVEETLAALKAIAQLEDNRETPFWIASGITGELIAFPNGLLEIDRDRLHPPNPDFFTLGALGFNYQPKRGEPKEWLGFLDQVFDKAHNQIEASDQIEALQEIFGYLLTSDISQEKCFMLLGPPRSGKGTMAQMMRALLASTIVSGPTLSEFGTEFGLSALIGKQLAIIDDLRVARKDQNLMVENVLKISGRGHFTINRKYLSFWTGVLPVKLMIISNEMPRLGDDSPALSGRFIILTTRQSFLGREDPDLFKTKLRPELVDVFHWALDGLRRLRANRRFKEPQASEEARAQMANLGSLVMSFISERCELDPFFSVDKDRLYKAYKQYAAENDMPADTKEKFFTALYAATGGRVKATKPTEAGKRVRACQGIKLRPEAQQSSSRNDPYFDDDPGWTPAVKPSG
jgi:putative DNA primase/helicase